MSRAESPAKQPMETFQEFPSRALAMNRIAISGGKPPDIRKGVIVFVLTLTAMLFLPGHAHAQDASRVLKAMSDYLTGQKTISMTFDSDIEVITSELQKIQFTSSGQVLLNRPDKLRATRTGGYADVEFVFDGKTATVLGKHLNAFAQADAPGSVDQLSDHLRDRYKVAIPGADLLLSRVYEELTADVIDSNPCPRSPRPFQGNTERR